MLGYSFTITPISLEGKRKQLKHHLLLLPGSSERLLSIHVCFLPYLSNGGSVDGTKVQLLFLLQQKAPSVNGPPLICDMNTKQYLWFCRWVSFFPLGVRKTHIVLADLADKVEDFIHGSWCGSEHRERLLIHLIYCHPSKRQINSFSINVRLLHTIPGLFPPEQKDQLA